MAAHDAQGRHARDAGGLHVLLAALDQRGAAHGARILHPAGQGNRQNQHAKGHRFVRIGKHRAPHTGDQQSHQNGGEREHDVTHPHQHAVHPTAQVARHQAQRDAYQHRQHHRRDTHDQRNARTVDHGGENVAPLVVRAQKVFARAQFAPRGRQAGITQLKRSKVEWIVW